MSELSRYVSLLGWGALGVLCAFLCLIARLFQRRTGLRTRPEALAVAGAVLVGTGVLETVAGDGSFSSVTSALLAFAGVVMVAAVLRVYGLMVGRLP